MDIVERLRVRWEKMDGAAATKIAAILKDRRDAADEIERLQLLLSQIDTTMCMHGKVDAGTDPHDRIQRAYGVE